jgi:hypothetical protein
MLAWVKVRSGKTYSTSVLLPPCDTKGFIESRLLTNHESQFAATLSTATTLQLCGQDSTYCHEDHSLAVNAAREKGLAYRKLAAAKPALSSDPESVPSSSMDIHGQAQSAGLTRLIGTPHKTQKYWDAMGMRALTTMNKPGLRAVTFSCRYLLSCRHPLSAVRYFLVYHSWRAACHIAQVVFDPVRKKLKDGVPPPLLLKPDSLAANAVRFLWVVEVTYLLGWK